MGVSSGRARVADLALRVYERALHPEWFACREHRRISRERWEADVRIIDVGHVVVFALDRIRITEVLAGPETILPEPGLLYRSPVRQERSTILRAGGLVEYQACFEVERLEPEIFRHLSEEMAADGSQSHLFHRFGTTNRLAPAPLGHVHVDSRVRGLTIHSFHTFPDECAVVRTQSLYEIISQKGSDRD